MENPPAYPGGIEKFYRFLGDNIKYPPMAAENNIQGNVFVSFTVEKDGSLTDIKIDRKLGYGTDEEAVRVLKLSKRWNPGMQNGKPVRVKYNIPIKFSLQQ
jgi:protein TonB